MAPSKFEKHMRKSLQEREIPPSANAWDRISEQLAVSEKPKSKRLHRYGIAAGFMGLLLVSGWFFEANKLPDMPQTVKEGMQEEKSVLQEPKTEVSAQEKINERTVSEKKASLPDKPIKIVALPRIEEQSRKNAITFVDRSVKAEKVEVLLKTSNELIDTKIAEIVAKVELLEKENTLVTEAEIDTLLRRAQQEIIRAKIINDDNSVDPMALLADVEDELDKSFRDQIFDALKDGFIRVRTAVADRTK